ncbi:peptidoglycan-binding domain-containing protein [Streptomyces scabiei]|uniref:peptidoglycan-binding domain-containing protein n=1 Tax=Streptomyces scabiei TaxID=1930 RepID=UPI002FF1B666
MSEPTSHICPECSTPRASDGTPSCACGRRASEALLETRTAEAAAAEDFDPLRIRPYVELGDAPGEHDGSRAAAGRGPASDRAATIAMPMTTATTGATTATGATDATGPGPMGVRPFGRRGEGTPGTGFGAWGTPPSPGPAPLSADRTSPGTPAGRPGRRRRRRAGLVVVLAGTAAAGVMAAAGFASGLFSYNAPERDRALPDDLRASAPDASPDGEASPAGPSGEGGGGGGAPAPAPPGGGAGAATASPSRSPSPSEASGSPSPSVSAEPTQSAAPGADASTGASATGSDGSKDSRKAAPKTLRPGDDDPEVTELQLRLSQLGIYTGDIDDNYDSQVEQAVLVYQSSRGITKDQDEPGVYGLVTRERLESETKEP